MIENFDFTSIEALRTSFTVIAPLIVVGLTQLLKKTFPGQKRYLNFVAIAIALVLAFLVYGLTVPALFGGLAIGLTSIGFYETAKNTAKKK